MLEIQDSHKILTFRDSKGSTPWIIYGYIDPNSIVFKASGEGVEDMVEKLKDFEIAYMLVRCQYNENDTGFQSDARTKDVFITWIGPRVPILEKGKKTSHLGGVKAFFQPYHAEITAI
ncbi:hypothetical protein CYY_003326 [Polysphondylium violaceum]|uniref:ADF-H domain-containing protein n=1 Tax=Polysphondylium violaceum TaxID=133409 RepID=A0A8J4PXV1_9MYCE|nr:hypothetical protein CYY_003326 [Polysphondylium violaceum]